MKALYPNRSSPDFALSVGTGRSDSTLAAFKVGPHSPVKDRFLSRLCRTFMRSLDGEKIWQDLVNSLPDQSRAKYHRLNLPIKGAEPLLDDLTAIEDLKARTVAFLHSSQEITCVLDSIYASMFYFEFDGLPQWRGGSYACAGNIFCRLQLSHQGRKALYDQLLRTSSYFLVIGEPTPCVEKIPRSSPPFKKHIRFTLNSLSDTLGVTLRGITSQPRTISGLPKTAEEIINLQMIDAPFGRCDHLREEKELPQLPRKRKYSELVVG